MVFADGENLVNRYQAMVSDGYVPRDDMYHEKDVAVWTPGFTHLANDHEIIRVTYYTYVVGSLERIDSVNESIKQLRFSKHMSSTLRDKVTPCVFKKNSKSRKAKGVDIQICIDVLNHVHRNNVDAILLLSGDGDYEPLIDDVLRSGVQVYLSAYESGLNHRLKYKVDRFYELGGTTWKNRPSDSE
jgi:uncharacterized LabA/DUF88 family protein